MPNILINRLVLNIRMHNSQHTQTTFNTPETPKSLSSIHYAQAPVSSGLVADIGAPLDYSSRPDDLEVYKEREDCTEAQLYETTKVWAKYTHGPRCATWGTVTDFLGVLWHSGSPHRKTHRYNLDQAVRTTRNYEWNGKAWQKTWLGITCRIKDKVKRWPSH